MNFLDFPNDIQEVIYNKLNFIDKCAFDRTAKFKYIAREAEHIRKKLVILYKLITKKELTTLSFMQLKLLSMYNRISPGDPSIKEIATTFPEVYEKTPETLAEKIKSGHITEEDLQNITQNDISNRLYEVIAQQNVDMFKLLYQNELIKKHINIYSSCIYFSTILECNEELFLYLRNNIVLEADMYNNERKMSINFIASHKTHRTFLLKHFTYTREEIKIIKKQCLDNLYMDAYLEFAKL
jgi:hypothetical protein